MDNIWTPEAHSTIVIVNGEGCKHCKTIVNIEFMSQEDEGQKCEEFSKYGWELLECIRARAATHPCAGRSLQAGVALI